MRFIGSFLIVMIALLMAGCGGGGGGGGSSPSTGAVLAAIRWPEVGIATQSARVLLLNQAGGTVAERTVQRDAGAPTQSVAFEGIGPGTYTLLYRTYANNGATGAVTAEGAASVVLSAGQTRNLTAGFGNAVTALSVLPANSSVGRNQTLQLYVAATTANGEIALLAPGTLQWNSNSAAVTVNQNGLATGVSQGTATITARVIANNVSGTTSLRVGAAWTVMVFMNAANDLDTFGVDNINQMEAGLTSSDVQVVVEWKRINQFANKQRWVGTRRYKVQHDTDYTQVKSPLVQTLPENHDMGNANNLRAFIQWAQQNYPAENYALVIWNHGNGILVSSMNQLTRFVSFDEGTGNAIAVWQLDDAMSGLGVDVTIFDASLMQMLEVAYQIRNQTRVVVGSEESPPGEGYPYDAIMARLSQNPNVNPLQFGPIWVNETLQAYVGRFNNITQSAVDTERLPAVASALNSFGQTLQSRGSLFQTQLRNARLNAPTFKNSNYRDLVNLAQRMVLATNDPQITASATTLVNAVNASVLAEGNSLQRDYANGLSVYYTAQNGYSPLFDQLDLATAAPQWRAWLQQAP